MRSCKEQGGCDELDRWIDTREREIADAAFELIEEIRHYLYEEA